MFNFSGGLLAGQHDCRKERPPPSRPTPVTFPSFTPPEPFVAEIPPAWIKGPSPGISAHFLTLKKPSDVNSDTLALLNITFRPPCDFETLVSSVTKDGRSYIPPKSWLETSDLGEGEAASASASSVDLLSNARKAPDRNDFYIRAKELFFKNEDAFTNLTRKGNGSGVSLRLAHFRRFWEGLDNLAYYWDCSIDEYIPPKQEKSTATAENLNPSESNTANGKSQEDGAEGRPALESIEEPRKKAKTSADGNEILKITTNPTEAAASYKTMPTTPIFSSKTLPARIAPPKMPWSAKSASAAERQEKFTEGSYRGFRIGNGAEMPDQYRLDCVRSFLEPIAWSFGVTFVPHRRPPVLNLEQVRFPVRMNTVGWRGPADRIKARQGWMEGPVLGVQCRPDTNFGSTGNLEAESVLDMTRELGGLLLLAQERAREGKTEKRAGEGKWWTTVPRWGGGPGGQVGEAAGASDDSSPAPVTPKVEEKPARSRLGSKDRRRPSPVEVWKNLRPGNPLWDPKIVYDAIGKDRKGDWDEVFMVSSLNHHISVLKLRVHSLYMQYLTEGVLPKKEPSDPQWKSPVLQRTPWYDLFSIEERTEAMRGIWGIMAYLMRAQDQGTPDVTLDEN